MAVESRAAANALIIPPTVRCPALRCVAARLAPGRPRPVDRHTAGFEGALTMDLNIAGLRVLVTAGASGIGLATARAFAREGAKVVICDVDTAALGAVAASDAPLRQTVCDVADPAAVARMFETA